jgi:uncharacterized protein (DUF433 family)
MLRAVGDPSPVRLGQGAYTVPETCRILRPSMTSRKVHYWLNTELLGDPLRRGRQGVPTLLTFEQVLKVRTLQRLRDELKFSLQGVRRDLGRLLEAITSEEWHELAFEWHALAFFRSGGGELSATLPDGESLAIRTGQGVMESVVVNVEELVRDVREQWDARRLRITGFEHIVSDAQVLGGSPVIAGTRIETAFVANLAQDVPASEIQALFPHVDDAALDEAAKFEGAELRLAA